MLTISGGVDVLHVRRARRHRRGDERLLRARHAVSLAPPALGAGVAPAPPVVRPGRALRRGLLPPECQLGQPPAGRALRLPRALRRLGHAGADRDPEREHAPARLRGLPRARRGLRGHHLGQAPRLRARRSLERSGSPAGRARDVRRGAEADPDRGPRGRPQDAHRPLPGRPDRRRGSRLRPLPRTARTLGSHRRRRSLARPGDGRRARGAPHRRAGDARGRRCRVDAAGAARSWGLGEPAARLRPLDRGLGRAPHAHG